MYILKKNLQDNYRAKNDVWNSEYATICGGKKVKCTCILIFIHIKFLKGEESN